MTTDVDKLKEAALAWIDAWNSGDFQLLLEHYADDIVFYSSTVIRRWDIADGKLMGKKALEKHFRKAFEEVSGMKLTFKHLLLGIDGLLLIYQRETGRMSADFVKLNEFGKVKEIRVFNEIVATRFSSM